MDRIRSRRCRHPCCQAQPFASINYKLLHAMRLAEVDYSALTSLALCGYFFVWFANDSPLFHIPSPRSDRDEPAIFNQRFGQAYLAHWISGTVGAIDADIPRGDDGLMPSN